MSGGEDTERNVEKSPNSHMAWLKHIAYEQAEMTKEQIKTNQLLREDINTTKAILNQHIILCNESREKDDRKFNVLFSIARSRDDYFKGLKIAGWVLVIILTGLLTAFGGDLYKRLFENPANNQNKELTVKPTIKVIK